MSTTLIIGLPGSGKTTYAKEHCKGCLFYDLDYLKAALTYSDVHDPDDEGARKVADSFLSSFLIFAPLQNRDLCVIRTAPKIAEMESIKPDKMVVMLSEYDITDRPDYHEVDTDEYNMRINACIKWCDKNGVELLLKE